MDKKVATLVVVLIVGVFIVWGLSAMQKNSGDVNMKPNPKPTPASTTPSPAPAPAKAAQADISKLLKNPPGAGASQDLLKAFSSEVASKGVETSTLDVTKCDVNPNVIIVKQVYMIPPLHTYFE